MRKFSLPVIPESNIPNGLIAVFDRETDTDTRFAFADIEEGQQDYELPDDGRKVVGVYVTLDLPL